MIPVSSTLRHLLLQYSISGLTPLTTLATHPTICPTASIQVTGMVKDGEQASSASNLLLLISCITDRPDERAQYEHPGSHPSPPPIATLHSSPAPSAENSSLTSPSPPVRFCSSVPETQYLTGPMVQLSQPGYYQGSAQNGPGMHPGSYTYAPAPHARYPADPASAHQMQSHYPPSSHYQPQQSAQVSTRSIRPTFVPSHPLPQQPAYIVHTDDAATKLNDRVRRKCYNCRTTDTSTWRRSSLAPGKVVGFSTFSHSMHTHIDRYTALQQVWSL